MTDSKLKVVQEMSDRIKSLQKLLGGTAILRIHGLGMDAEEYFQIDDFCSIDASAIKAIRQALNDLLSRLVAEYEKI